MQGIFDFRMAASLFASQLCLVQALCFTLLCVFVVVGMALQAAFGAGHRAYLVPTFTCDQMVAIQDASVEDLETWCAAWTDTNAVASPLLFQANLRLFPASFQAAFGLPLEPGDTDVELVTDRIVHILRAALTWKRQQLRAWRDLQCAQPRSATDADPFPPDVSASVLVNGAGVVHADMLVFFGGRGFPHAKA